MKTSVFVLGSIHDYHMMSPNYTLLHLLALLEKAQPEVVCIEVRPEDFTDKNKQWPSPVEMKQVYLWSVERGLPVYPIDWWLEEWTEQRRNKHKYLSDKQKELFDSLKPLTDEYRRRSFEAIQHYKTALSQEHCDFLRQYYQELYQVFGDGLPNGWWEKRNGKMWQLIRKAIEQHPGKRVVVVTGCDHKYWFDDRLREREDVELLQLNDLGEIEVDQAELAAWKRQNFAERMFALLESMLANSEPDRAAQLIDENVDDEIDAMIKQHPDDGAHYYWKGMYYYLTREYSQALEQFCQAECIGKTDHKYLKPLFKPLVKLRIAMMHDLLGQHEAAVPIYQSVTDLVGEEHRFADMAKMLIAKPFGRPVSD